METDYLPKDGQYESGNRKGKYETNESDRKTRIRHAIERFSESRSSGSLSKVDFRGNPRAHVSGRSEQHEQIGDVFIRNRPHPFYSQLLCVSGYRKR